MTKKEFETATNQKVTIELFKFINDEYYNYTDKGGTKECFCEKFLGKEASNVVAEWAFEKWLQRKDLKSGLHYSTLYYADGKSEDKEFCENRLKTYKQFFAMLNNNDLLRMAEEFSEAKIDHYLAA